jgi:hypothetical protein
MEDLTAYEKRLVILKLMHFKNELIQERMPTLKKKIERDFDGNHDEKQQDLSREEEPLAAEDLRNKLTRRPEGKGYWIEPQPLSPKPQRLPKNREGRTQPRM